MGTVHQAKCRDCGHVFKFSEGGGFKFAIINCNSCHLAISVSWEVKRRQNTHGKCSCGGTYSNEAKPRCEKCESANIEDLGTTIYFD
ncbi:MAG: hypothetical protein E4G98_05680 [Promethearchaeota archaeon]|nr:MAG: hypothetical protein E4G98_05680 [Candidatus Lokiarchaeota archaeon]